jgi:hypothetical protein
MFKRLFWLTVGLSVGFGTSYWTVRWVRRTIERYTPERLAEDATRLARSLRTELAAAAREGRAAMRSREAELWAELGRTRP